jgi:hypothetical protein
MHLDISKGDMILVGAEIPFSNAVETAKDGVRYFNQAAEALQKRADVLLRQSRWDGAKADLKESRRLFTRTENEKGKSIAS